ncbi:MAG: hypothetical protein N3A38_15270, partial [Planctomycetota bacterium]|nr:hypothetical protein [Planctomycetota bacterium]
MARYHVLFLTGSAALLALCGYLMMEERERTRLAREIDGILKGLEAARAGGMGAAEGHPASATGLVPGPGPVSAGDMPLDLGATLAPREDRCVLCHVTIADPRYADLDLLCDGRLLTAALKEPKDLSKNVERGADGSRPLPSPSREGGTGSKDGTRERGGRFAGDGSAGELGESAAVREPAGRGEARAAPGKPSDPRGGTAAGKPSEVTGTRDADEERYIRERYGDPVAVIRRTRELAATFGVSRALPPAARALKAHPRLDLYVGPDSPHPLADYGCTICHGGMGIGTSFRSAAHSPGDAATRKRWEAEYGWSPVESWLRPMLPVRYVEASCAKCHYGTDRVRGAPTLSRGLDLASELGCCNCHPFGVSSPFEWVGRVGWDLRRVSTKTAPGWTVDFLMDPTAFRPASRMTRFFGIG